MQATQDLIPKKKPVKLGSEAPTKKSLYGTKLDNPVLDPQLLDSTRLKVEPGGARSSPILSSNTHPTPKTVDSKPPPFSYKAALCTGLPTIKTSSKEEARDITPSLFETSLPAERKWRTVRYGKQDRSYSDSSSISSSQSRQSSDRNFPLAQRPVPAKRNSASTNQQLPERRRSVKKPPGNSGTANNRLKVAPCTEHSHSYLKDLTMKREILEIWWQILGFTGQRGPLKQDDYKRALVAMGFTIRNQKGAQVSYKPPPNFESTRGLTVHFPHQGNIEYTELMNKAKTIEKQYPDMVCTLRQLYV
ncbi:unnamed protein product [Rhizoctonia solani]|uniref:Uncharacterized protein n=1 Tax=Rhizoctonia solani TaxID=456999 RepID=A0A8H2WSQ2_9AGAM|nr:unnamed protein product [Rhizoctonia solani]